MNVVKITVDYQLISSSELNFSFASIFFYVQSLVFNVVTRNKTSLKQIAIHQNTINKGLIHSPKQWSKKTLPLQSCPSQCARTPEPVPRRSSTRSGRYWASSTSPGGTAPGCCQRTGRRLRPSRTCEGLGGRPASRWSFVPIWKGAAGRCSGSWDACLPHFPPVVRKELCQLMQERILNMVSLIWYLTEKCIMKFNKQ